MVMQLKVVLVSWFFFFSAQAFALRLPQVCEDQIMQQHPEARSAQALAEVADWASFGKSYETFLPKLEGEHDYFEKDAKIEVTFTIFNGLQDYHQARALKQVAEAERFTAKTTRQTLFAGLMGLHLKEATYLQHQERLQKLAKLFKKVKSQLPRFKSLLLLLENQTDQTETELKNIQREVDALLGTSNPTPCRVELKKVSLSDEYPTLNHQERMRAVHRSNPEILSLQKKLKSTRFQLRKAKGAWSPEITTAMGYHLTDWGQASESGAWKTTLVFSATLFSGLDNVGDLQAARATVMSAEYDLKAFERRVISEIDRYYTIRDNAQRSRKRLGEVVGFLTADLNRRTGQFKSGKYAFRSLVNDMRDLLTHTTDLNKAERAYHLYQNELNWRLGHYDSSSVSSQ